MDFQNATKIILSEDQIMTLAKCSCYGGPAGSDPIISALPSQKSPAYPRTSTLKYSHVYGGQSALPILPQQADVTKLDKKYVFGA